MVYVSKVEPRSGAYLNEAERWQIACYLKDGLKVSEIAIRLGRHRSTIYREIARGAVEQQYKSKNDYHPIRIVYDPDVANDVTRANQRRKGALPKLAYDPDLLAVIDDHMLKDHWSPETIVGRLDREGALTTKVCFKTIYNYVNAGRMRTKPENLLRKGMQKSPKKDEKNYEPKSMNTKGTPIDLRPKEISKREEFGHWEGDTVHSGTKTGSTWCIYTFVERKTRFGLAFRMPNASAESTLAVHAAIEEVFGDFAPYVIKTITYDNGSEFSFPKDELVRDRSPAGAEECEWELYYAHPYRSGERGSNENFNGIMRRWVPKGCDIGKFSDADIYRASDWINDMPRGILDWDTARERFNAELALIEEAQLAA